MNNTERVATPDLQDGDVIMHHCVTMRLSGKRLSRCHEEHAEAGRPVYVFDVEVLAGTFTPSDWNSRFKVQGNDLAMWSRLA